VAGELMNVVVLPDEAEPVVFVADGYLMPSSLTVHGEIAYGDKRSGNLVVEVGVAIENKRAVPRWVKVTSPRPRGVSATTLRDVPIRELAARGCLQALRRVEPQPDGTARFVDGAGLQGVAEAVAVVETLVGYVDEEKIRGSVTT
jgi:hypothetical protein